MKRSENLKASLISLIIPRRLSLLFVKVCNFKLSSPVWFESSKNSLSRTANRNFQSGSFKSKPNCQKTREMAEFIDSNWFQTPEFEAFRLNAYIVFDGDCISDFISSNWQWRVIISKSVVLLAKTGRARLSKALSQTKWQWLLLEHFLQS